MDNTKEDLPLTCEELAIHSWSWSSMTLPWSLWAGGLPLPLPWPCLQPHCKESMGLKLTHCPFLTVFHIQDPGFSYPTIPRSTSRVWHLGTDQGSSIYREAYRVAKGHQLAR